MRPNCLTATIMVKAAVLSLRVVVRETSPKSAAPAPAPIPKMTSHKRLVRRIMHPPTAKLSYSHRFYRLRVRSL